MMSCIECRGHYANAVSTREIYRAFVRYTGGSAEVGIRKECADLERWACACLSVKNVLQELEVSGGVGGETKQTFEKQWVRNHGRDSTKQAEVCIYVHPRMCERRRRRHSMVQAVG
jgi:hypothetical protein